MHKQRGLFLALCVLIITVACSKSSSGIPDNSGRWQFSENDKMGFLDDSGKVVINPTFDAAGTFTDGLAAVRVGERWGYINPKGDLVVNPQFDGAGEFAEGLAPVKVKDRYGYIDKKGQTVWQPQW